MKLSIQCILGLVLLLPVSARAQGSEAGPSATLDPDEQVYSLHQPVTARFVLRNDSDRPARVDFGRDFRGNIHLVVNGVSIPPPGLPPGGGISFPGEVELDPGAHYSRRLLLDDWYHFDLPGSYQVRVVLESTPLRLEAAATVVIGPRDPDRLAKACATLAHQAESYEAEPALFAAEALSYVSDEACLESLAEVLRESIHAKEGAITGLVRIGTKPALRAIADAWDALRWDQKALALNEAEQRGKKEALRKELLKVGKSDIVRVPGAA